MTATSFRDLDRGQGRRLVARSGMRILATTVAFVVLYAVTPVPGETGAQALVRLVIGLLVFAGALAWQLHSIVRADHPELRAVEAVAVAVPVLVIVFAFTYLSVSQADPQSFSEPLDRIGAMYFTVTVIGTVGFGDIAARSDAARMLVTIQIFLDLVVVVGIARTVVLAARIGVRRQQGREPSSPDG